MNFTSIIARSTTGPPLFQAFVASRRLRSLRCLTGQSDDQHAYPGPRREPSTQSTITLIESGMRRRNPSTETFFEKCHVLSQRTARKVPTVTHLA